MFIFVEGFKNISFIRNKDSTRHKSIKHNVIEARRGENYKPPNKSDNAVRGKCTRYGEEEALS